MLSIHRYGVVLHHVPGRAEMQFIHFSPKTGSQVWDTQMWPVSSDVRTEREFLNEIYEGVLCFMERRA